MAYEVLARKWRPQQFDAVVGQEHVTRTLRNAIETGRVAHAYLFVGPRGVGKTSIARIMAKALNCSKSSKGAPCDACEACREISAGNSLDVLEIDGASNNGVDQIRDLRDNVKFLPARGPFKIYIIDEVHMLSIGAFNALLKTLEEPPPHVKFIFATTEPQKVPATILSRCQRFDLRRISTGAIAAHLGTIAKAEDIKVDDDALLALARGAEGGLRDAESALDQVVSFRGKKVTEDDVLQVFGLVSRRHLEELCGAVLSGSADGIFRIISELDAAGKDLSRLAAEVLDYFRNLMVAFYAPKVLEEQGMSEHQLKLYLEQSKSIDAGRLSRIVDQIILAQSQLKYALSRRVVLEMALVRAARAATVMTLDEAITELKKTADEDSGPVEGSSRDEPRHRPEKAAPPARDPDPSAQKKTSDEVIAAPDEADSELAMLFNHWSLVCDKVSSMAPLARAYVRNTRPAEVGDVVCVIGCDPEYAANLPSLRHPKCIAAFQYAISDVLGRKVTVHLSTLDQAQTGSLPSDVPVSPEPQEADAVPEGDKPLPAGAEAHILKTKWSAEPSVNRVLDMFNGSISDIRK